jgi:polyhydroxyalkanoate synthesis regulator phasin
VRYLICFQLEDKMTIPNNEKEEETKGVRGALYETTRLVLLAGVGAISIAQEEINNFLDRLVERGELAESDARKLVREVMERREKLEKEHKEHVKEAKQQPAQATHADIEALNARIAELTRQIEELRNQQPHA